jgi:hypothetical protein
MLNAWFREHILERSDRRASGKRDVGKWVMTYHSSSYWLSTRVPRSLCPTADLLFWTIHLLRSSSGGNMAWSGCCRCLVVCGEAMDTCCTGITDSMCSDGAG